MGRNTFYGQFVYHLTKPSADWVKQAFSGSGDFNLGPIFLQKVIQYKKYHQHSGESAAIYYLF
jgi:hypothetical protein